MTLHFKSKEGYRKYEAYKHIHHLGGKDSGEIFIAGKLHKPEHVDRLITLKRQK